MENNIEENKTQTCKCCGRELPLTSFAYHSLYGKHNTTCKECARNKRRETKMKNQVIAVKEETPKLNEALQGFSSRELILELRARGYKGELYYTEIKKVVI